MMLLAFVMATTPLPTNLGPAWAEFSRAPARRAVSMTVEVGTLGYDRGRQRLDFWLRRTIVTHAKGPVEQVTWADTRTCPTARATLASMRDIPVPRFAPIGSTDGPPIIADGISYSLRTYSDQGRLTAQTNIDTPLAAWVETALKALDPCWGTTVPARTP